MPRSFTTSCPHHPAAKRPQAQEGNRGGKGPARPWAGGRDLLHSRGGLSAPGQSLHCPSCPQLTCPRQGLSFPRQFSPGRRIASALSSYHEPPQYVHRSLSPHRQYFDFWNSSYLARDSKYIPDNFLSPFLIISFSLKLVFENMYWDDRLFITADGQYSSHLCPTPHNA